MTIYNKIKQMKPFDLKNIIKQRVNREAEVEWSKTQTPESPKFTKPETIPLSAGVYNLVRQMLP